MQYKPPFLTVVKAALNVLCKSLLCLSHTFVWFGFISVLSHSLCPIVFRLPCYITACLSILPILLHPCTIWPIVFHFTYPHFQWSRTCTISRCWLYWHVPDHFCDPVSSHSTWPIHVVSSILLLCHLWLISSCLITIPPLVSCQLIPSYPILS